jgi:ABC-type bacteriocin/lantibiotic exporter with double-glycine peptidase domain
VTAELKAPPDDASPDSAARDGVGLEGAASILEQLLSDSPLAVDRARLRRVIREAADAYPGAVAEQWWHWLSEASVNLGLKCKVVDCTPEEVRNLASYGMLMVLYVPGPEPWRAIAGRRGQWLRLAQAPSQQIPRWRRMRYLHGHIGEPRRGDLLRCLIVEPSSASGTDVASEAHEMTPLARWWSLVRPEAPDLLILLIFSIVVALLTLASPIAVESLVSTVAFGRLLQPVVVLSLMLFAFLAFSAAMQALQFYVAEILQCRLFARIAADLAFRLPRVRTESVDHEHLPELVNRFFEIVTVQKVTTQLLLDGLSLVLSMLVGMVVLAFYHPWLLGFDAILLLLMGIVVFILGRGAVETSIRESRCKYHMAAWLEDLARCPLGFKADGGAEFALERADLLITDYLKARKSHFQVLMRQILFALSTQSVTSAVLLGMGGWLVMTGQLTLGQLVAAELIVTVIVGAFAKLRKDLEGFYDLMASMDKLGHLFDLPVEDQDGILHRFPDRPAALSAIDLDYSFPGGHAVLEGVRLEIRPGEHTALTGPGKSVLLDLIFRLRAPTSGHLTIDGVDPRDLRPDVLRRRAALVREAEVFQGSIAENVHLHRPEITSNMVREALELVGLLDSVLRLPDGIETEVCSSGRPLTGSQIQRLMLARAVVGRPGLLLIDGALDSLADEEADVVLRNLCHPGHGWTLILVSSRRSLRKYCLREIDLSHHAAYATLVTPSLPKLENMS